MVSKSKMCSICKHDSNNLISIVSSDVQMLFNQNVAIDICISCLGKIKLILDFLKSIKKLRNKNQTMCSICSKMSLYLFNINQKNRNEFIEKIQYCQYQNTIDVLKNICYRCLYLTELWYDLKKEYETGQPKYTPEEKNEENSRFDLKRKLSFSRNNILEKNDLKLPNKRQKNDSSIDDGTIKGETKNTKLQKLHRELQLNIRDAETFFKPTRSKRRRNSTATINSIISIHDSMENLSIIDNLKPANTYFTNNRKKWLKPEIKSDSKMLNLICHVDLSTSVITEKVLKRLEERHFVRVKTITSEVENENQTALSTAIASVKNSKTNKFTAARKFPKTVPKTKRNFQSELDEIRSYRSTVSPPLRKSPASDCTDRTDFDYGMNRHSYDAFSTDKEKVVMVLLHNVEEFEKKANKRISDDMASITSTSSDKTDNDNEDIIDEDEERLGRFTCLENYMAGLPHLILNRMDNNEISKNLKIEKKTSKQTSFKEMHNMGDEFITPEKNSTFDDIRREIENKVRNKTETNSNEHLNIISANSKDSFPKTSMENSNKLISTQSSSDKYLQKSCANTSDTPTDLKEGELNVVSDDDTSDKSKENLDNAIETDSQDESEGIELRLSEEEKQVSENVSENKKQINTTDAEKSQGNSNGENLIVVVNDDDDEVICLDTQEEVENTHNDNITNSTVNTQKNNREAENNDHNEIHVSTRCNVEICTTTSETKQNDLNEDTNINQNEKINTSLKDNQFCQVAQKLAELDA